MSVCFSFSTFPLSEHVKEKQYLQTDQGGYSSDPYSGAQASASSELCTQLLQREVSDPKISQSQTFYLSKYFFTVEVL